MQASKLRKQVRNELESSRQKLDQKPDVTLKQLWAEAQDNFFRKTGSKIDESFDNRISNEAARILLVEDAEEDKANQKEPRGRFSKDYVKKVFKHAKKIFSNVFNVIWKFSEFFMPMATSIPFVGSGVTLMQKAIELLIVTTKDYREIFTKAAELFEQVGFFSIRFEMLMEAEQAGAQVHRKFMQFLNVMIAHTIDCVALFVKITNESKLKAGGTKESLKHAGLVTAQFFKTMGGDDQGVGDHLARLRTLVDEERKLSSALVLATVLKIHTDVIAIRGNVNTVTNQLHTMHEMIGPSKIEQLKKLLFIDGEPWNSRFRACADRRISGTGDWLMQHDLLVAWTSNSANDSQVLAIEAASRSGKTYLATAAIIHLREHARQVQTPAAVACYLFDKTAKGLTTGDVVRAIVYQLCAQDSRFFEIAFPIIQQDSDKVMSGSELWSTLVLGVISKIAQFTCFVVLDGLDLVDELQELPVLCSIVAKSSTAPHNLRFLLTGNDKSLSTLTGYDNDSITRLPLDCTYPNSKDLALVADAHLAHCPLFVRGASGVELLEYKASVSKRLVEMVSGDYYILSSCLGDMRQALSKIEVEQILRKADEKRQNTIARNLSSLSERLSNGELLQLKYTLQLLAVLGRLGMPMPHLSVVQQYLTRDEVSLTLTKPMIELAYSNLLTVDDRNYVSLAIDEIADYLLVDSSDTEVTHALSQSGRNGQLKAIQQLLAATFTQDALEAHGFNDVFFHAKRMSSDLSQFTVTWNTAMADTASRLIESFINVKEKNRYQKTKRTKTVFELARELLPELLLRLQINKLEDSVKANLGTSLARLFLVEDTLAEFMAIETQSQARDKWGADHRYFEAAFRLMQHSSVIKHLESSGQSYASDLKVRDIRNPNDLKMIMSRMVARRWFQSKSFWTYEEIDHMFHWFTIVPELKLELNNHGVNYKGFYDDRTKGWYTPPNWEKIRTWVKVNIPITDNADLDIQTATMLCGLGDKSNKPILLLEPHAKTNWRAAIWLAEASSMKEQYDKAYRLVHESMGLMFDHNVDQESMTRAIDEMLSWTGHWNNVANDNWMREKAFELNKSMPGLLSHRTISVALEIAVRAKGVDKGFSFFHSFYSSNKDLLFETFVRQASNNFMHIALSRTIANDEDGSRLSTLCDVYRNSMALCGSTDVLAMQDKTIARLRLGFWFGRLHFLHSTHCNLGEAIRIWEDLIKNFSASPVVADVEIMLPIITHLCSAYVRKALADPHSPNIDSIIASLESLIGVASFSKDPLTLKLRFRTSLCLARIHMARENAEGAHVVLHDHATCAFFMISQCNDRPLSSIGWFYLACMLTTLGQDAAWAWSRVQMHQQDRWNSFKGYAAASACENHPQTPSLDGTLRNELDAIKRGEEYGFWDGHNPNSITSTFPDDQYLPSYASMACDGRQCYSTPDDPTSAAQTYCEPLQIPAQYTDPNGRFPPAQGDYHWGWPRKSFWVCRDCVSTKLCVTCYTSLKQGTLPLMGCHADHKGVFVEGSHGGRNAYEVLDEDLARAEELKRAWGIET